MATVEYIRRVIIVLSVVVVVLLGTIALRVQLGVVAQEATPASEEMAPEGVTFEPIGFAQGVTLPSLADLTAARSSFEPGAGFPFEPSDPEGAFVIVESGTITVRVEERTWTITRGSGSSEEVALGEEATLEAGDSAYVPGGARGEVRNTGQERADTIIFLASPSGAMADATPAP